MSEAEADADSQSTTSYEDFSKLHPDMLLYKAARARNLPVMREALALGADSNWQNEEDHHQTPLMKAIGSVSVTWNVSPMHFMLFSRFFCNIVCSFKLISALYAKQQEISRK